MDKKVYGVRIDEVNTNAYDINEMNDEEKWDFVCRNHEEDQVYTLDAFFYYLNANMLDTENYYWIMI